MNNFRNRSAAVNLDGERLEMLRTLLANLFIDEYQAAGGVVSRLIEMGSHKIEPEMLATELEFDKTVIRALKRARDTGLVATPENILPMLATAFPHDAQARLNALLGYRTNPVDVTPLAMAMSDWLGIQGTVMELEKIIHAGRGQYMSPEEFFAMASKAITKGAPVSKRVSTKSDIEAVDTWHDNRLETAKNLRAGVAIGPNFPWPKMNEYVPAVKLGWLMTIFAKTGHGKSTIALLLAMHWAYTQGYDVLFLHLETDIVDMMDRYIAKEMVIPGDSWDKGKAFIDDEPFATKFQEARAKIINLSQTMGMINYKHCPGATADDIAAFTAEFKVAADVRGRELIVIVDYYTKIGGIQNGQTSTQHHNRVADKLKEIAESEETKCYMVALAQFDADTDYSERAKAADGGNIYTNSQLYVRIERDQAMNDDFVKINGAKVKDILGNEIYYHRMGEEDSNASLNILKCNQGRKGRIPVKFTNAYFKVDSAPERRTIAVNLSKL